MAWLIVAALSVGCIYLWFGMKRAYSEAFAASIDMAAALFDDDARKMRKAELLSEMRKFPPLEPAKLLSRTAQAACSISVARLHNGASTDETSNVLWRVYRSQLDSH